MAYPQAVSCRRASAELRDLPPGSVSRGVDAETQLATLLGGAGHFALLCVDQGMPLAAMAPLKTGGAAFMSAIESEVETVADGSAARFIGERVKEQLAVLVTAHHGRPTGEYKSALDELAKLEKQREEAQTRLGRAQERLDELERLRNRLAQLADPEAVQAREQAANEARRAFEEAREAREKARAAEQAVATCEKHLGALKHALDVFDRRAGERAKLQVAVDDSAPLLADAEAHAGALQGARGRKPSGARRAEACAHRHGMQPAHAGAVGASRSGAPRPRRMRAHERRSRRQRSRG